VKQTVRLIQRIGDSRCNRVKIPIYPAGGNKEDAFSRTNGSRCRYVEEKGGRERKR